jgi:hypothetical protein
MDASKAMLAHGCAFIAFTFILIICLKISEIEGRREIPRGGRRYSPFGCRQQAGILKIFLFLKKLIPF